MSEAQHEQQQVWDATGRRKEASAHVWLTPGTGRITINRRPAREFLRREALEVTVREPLVLTGTDGRFDIKVRVRGGGLSGAAGAIRHAIARALVEHDPELREKLKRAGMLRRDARVKERKKPGQRGARARFQYSKR